jgi:hypothetical protein
MKTKTEKGVQAFIAGFVFSMVATLGLNLHLCAWMLLYSISVMLWVAGIGWIYADRKEYREQHQKSVEVSAWLFGISVFILLIGSLYYLVQNFDYLTSPGSRDMTAAELHSVYVTTINYGYIQLFSIVLFAFSRTFAVHSISGRKGKWIVTLALVLMLVVSLVGFFVNNDAYLDRDGANSRSAAPPNKKQLAETQFNEIAEQNKAYNLLPMVSELFFAFAYYSVNSRLASGEGKPRSGEKHREREG